VARHVTAVTVVVDGAIFHAQRSRCGPGASSTRPRDAGHVRPKSVDEEFDRAPDVVIVL
jgi:hypothetical protein